MSWLVTAARRVIAGPNVFVDVPASVHVLEPREPGRCWGLVRRSGHNKPYRCVKAARKGRLCCPSHAKLEGEARALKPLEAVAAPVKRTWERGVQLVLQWGG